jgi:hypothetical protein
LAWYVTVYCTLLLLKGWTMGGYLATRQPAIFLAELVSLAFVPLLVVRIAAARRR